MKPLKKQKTINWGGVDNIKRKLIHIVSALLIACFPYFLSLFDIVFLSLLFALIFLSAKIFNFLPVVNRVKRVSLGEVFYPLGILFSALIFLPAGEIRSFQFGVLVLGLSDSLANICGGLFGRWRFKLFKGYKSLAGSSAFFLTSFLLLLIMAQGDSSLTSYFLIALILTLIEALLFLGLDNLFLPVLAAYLFSLI